MLLLWDCFAVTKPLSQIQRSTLWPLQDANQTPSLGGFGVRGDAHTNSIENVWSLFKRSIMGSYHKLSVKHLDSYLDELEWRFNNRDNPYLFRDTLLQLIKAEHVEYQELTAD